VDQGFRDVLIVREELLRVFREAVAAVAERRIPVVRADAGVETDALDNLAGVEPLAHRVGVELIKERDTHREVGVREKLDRLGFGGIREKHRHVLILSPFNEEGREDMGLVAVVTDHDAGGVEVIVERVPLAEELRNEDHVLNPEAFFECRGVAHRNRRLDDDRGVRVDREDVIDHGLHGRRIKEIRLRVVIRRRRDHHEVRSLVRFLFIGRRAEVKGFGREEFLDLAVHDGALMSVDQVNLMRHDIERHHIVMLREKHRVRETHVADSDCCDFHLDFLSLLNAFWSPRSSRIRPSTT
jgi:hypothetical protein